MVKQVAESTQLMRRASGRSVAPAALPRRLVADLRKMIDESRHAVAQTVNTALVWLYWSIGRRIRADVLKQKRAEYGEQMIAAVSSQLTAEYGRGFSEANLRHMIRFAETFVDEKILYTLCRELSWSHIAASSGSWRST
jgi:hypothetical protein